MIATSATRLQLLLSFIPLGHSPFPEGGTAPFNPQFALPALAGRTVYNRASVGHFFIYHLPRQARRREIMNTLYSTPQTARYVHVRAVVLGRAYFTIINNPRDTTQLRAVASPAELGPCIYSAGSAGRAERRLPQEQPTEPGVRVCRKKKGWSLGA